MSVAPTYELFPSHKGKPLTRFDNWLVGGTSFLNYGDVNKIRYSTILKDPAFNDFVEGTLKKDVPFKEKSPAVQLLLKKVVLNNPVSFPKAYSKFFGKPVKESDLWE